jgi:hypothetical protein
MATIRNPYWFSPAQSELSASRLSLDFGLRAADLFCRELVVPQLGRIWFVRQLSWALGALTLREELRRGGASVPKATAISHGIEALACKLEFHSSEQESRRILGRRAFGRDEENEVWSFQRLRQRAYYVQNTHRQATTRAIRMETGLGFCQGTRFDLLELEPVGKALAEAFLKQRIAPNLGGSLRNWLLGWLRRDREVPSGALTLWRALSPTQPSRQEQELVHSRLLEISSKGCQKRQRLSKALGRAATMPDIEETVLPRLRAAGHTQQADEVVAARAFGGMLDRTREVTAEITRVVESARGGVRLSDVAGDSDVRHALARLRAAAGNFVARASVANVMERTSCVFAKEVGVEGDSELVRFLVPRVEGLLVLADGNVCRGPLFRRIDGADAGEGVEEGAASIEPDSTGRTFRLANLHSIVRDTMLRGPV